MSRVIAAFAQFFDGSGDPLALGWLRFTESSTNNTDKATYADVDQTIANANPLQLDAEGRCPNAFGQGLYRVVLYENNPITNTPGAMIQEFDPVVADYVNEGAGGNFADWESGITYQISQVVVWGGIYYRSYKANNLGNQPDLFPDQWEQIDFVHIWNSGVTYALDNIVIYGSQLYFSLANANTGNVPSTSPTWWDPVASGTILLNWSESSTSFVPNLSGYNLGETTNLIGNIYIEDGGQVLFGNDQDGTIYHDGSDFYAYTTTGAMYIGTDAADSLILSTNATAQWVIDSAGALLPQNGNDIGSATDLIEGVYLSDTGMILLGTNQDASIYHDGIDLNVSTGTGDLYLSTTTAQSITLSTNATAQWEIDSNGDLLPANNNDIGSATAPMEDIYLSDTGVLILGSDQDGSIYHDGSNLNIIETTADVNIQALADINLQTGGANTRWTIDSTGHLIPFIAGTYDIGSATYGVNDFYLSDSGSILFGSDQDASIYHDGSDLYLLNTVGDIYFGTNSANELILRTNSTNRIALDSNGHLIPVANNTYDIGSATYAMRSVYAATAPTTDYELCNKNYVDSVSGKSVVNAIINGGFRFWQRGTSSTSSGYLADRWNCAIGTSTATFSRQTHTVGQTDVPGNPKYYFRVVNTTGGTAASYTIFLQRMEDVQTFAGETVTVSFYAKADSAKNIATSFIQGFGTGGSSSVNSIGVTTHSLTSTWAKYSVTVSIPSISGKTVGTGSSLELRFWLDAGSDFDTNTNSLGTQSGTFDFDDIQVQPGSIADDFQIRPDQEELTLCQRFYQKSFPIYTTPAHGIDLDAYVGVGYGSSVMRVAVTFQQRMRSLPTITLYSPGSGGTGGSWIFYNGAWTPISSTATVKTEKGFYITGGATATFGNAYLVLGNWAADAEL